MVKKSATKSKAKDSVNSGNQNVDTSWRAVFNFTEKGHLVVLLPALFLSALSGILMPTLAIFFGKFFDAFSGFGAGTLGDHELTQKVLINTFALSGLGGATWLLKGSYFTSWLVFGELQAKSVRDALFRSLLERDLEWYESRTTGIGSLLSRLQSQIRELQVGTSQPLGFCINYIVQAIASLGVCFYYSWRVTLVTLAGVPVSFFLLSFISSLMQSHILAQDAEMTKASKIASNALTSIEAVKCLNGQNLEAGQYIKAIGRAATCYLKQAMLHGIQIGVVRFITSSMFVQGFWYGSYLVRTGQSSTGEVVTTFWSCLMATKAFEDILPHMKVLEKGRAAAIALEIILNKVGRGKKRAIMRTGITPRFCEGDIEIRQACVALAQINHESWLTHSGEITFVVGRSGSGKSTLGNLIMRFYRPNTGDIFIDKTPIQELDTSWLRNNITLVQQKSILFNETIFRNIAFGSQNYLHVKEKEVQACIDLAALRKTINDLPDGLNTMVGSGGRALSGGQKQRIAIARARLRDTPILILDESTSALDYLSRTAVMESIRKWRQGKTTIIITHDVAQIEHADFVYVLEEGRIAHEGYRRALELTEKVELFSFDPKSPQVHTNRQFNLDWGPRPSVSTNQRGYCEDETEEQADADGDRNSIDIHLNPVTENSESRPVLRALTKSRSLNPDVSRASYADDVTETTERQSTIQNMASFSSTSPQLDLNMLRAPKIRTGASAMRPVSIHQAMTMRTIYREPSVKRKSIPGSRFVTMKEIVPSGHERLPEKPVQEQKATIRSIFRTLWPSLDAKSRFILICGSTSVLVHSAGPPTFSYIFSQLLGTFFLKDNQARKALIYSMAILGISFADALACLFSWWLLEAAAEVWVNKLRIEAMTRILDQPKAWFDLDANSVSSVTSTLDRNAEEMRNLVGRFAGIIVTVFAMMVIAITWALITCWKLTLVGLTAGPILFSVTKAYEVVSSRWESRTNTAAEKTESIFVEAFSDIRTVRALTLESYFHKKYTLATSNALTIGIRRAIYSGFFFGASDSAISFVTALIFWYGATVARSHEFPVKSILTVFAMLLFSTANATSIIAFIPQISSSIDTASRLLRLANLPHRTSHEHTGTLRPTPTLLSGPISFNHTTFSYPNRPKFPALCNLSVTLPSGRCTAIVGASGSGKSTIAALLLGLYPAPSPDRGLPPALTIAHTDFRALHLPTLRSLVALVPQTPNLFPTSVYANIAYGLPINSSLNSTQNIQHAARRAGIHEFIVSLPQGYETLIGDGGLELSGGQAQRIVIARALVRRPKVLVLDEATSALDGASARLVREGVFDIIEEGGRVARSGVGEERARRAMTVIIITHNRDMMMCADNVVVMEQGRVVEEGGFRELVGRRGRLWEMLWVGGGLDE